MSLRHAILGVLEYEPQHGYALKRILERGIANFWPVNLQAIYPSLRRLEHEGLVTHETRASRSGRPARKVYSVTEEGRDELARWRRLPPPDDEPPRFRNGLFLKLLFAKRENLASAREWVRAAQIQTEARAARLRTSLDNESDPFFVRFLRESGLAHLELHATQLETLHERIIEILSRDRDRVEDEDDAPLRGAVAAFRARDGAVQI